VQQVMPLMASARGSAARSVTSSVGAIQSVAPTR
jgi:hypothetical protein